MVKDYSLISKEYKGRQWELIRATKETSDFIIADEDLPSSTNVMGFIETKLSGEELAITESTVAELLKGLITGELKCIAVLLAFLHRAVIAQQLVNPVSEFLIVESIERARELDKYFAEHGKPVGPLHGLPISIKDEFDLINQPTTLALISQVDSPRLAQSSPNIEILVRNGANVFLKSNIPTAAFNNVSNNQLFGKTVCPYNREFASGGSTGGEGALVALRGSALGVGSDLGGSIRQPCAFNGLYGMKPSSGRVPHYNSKIVVKGLEALRGTNGPMANDVESLGLYFKTVVGDRPWLKDTNVVPIPWDEANAKLEFESKKKLKFGILFDDGMIKPTPAITRALHLIEKKLVDAGHEVIEWNIKDHYDLFQIAEFAPVFMSSNGLKDFKDEINKTDELDLTGYEADDVKGSELWDLQDSRSLKVNEFWVKWQELEIDGLISPITSLSGCKCDGYFDYTYSPFANVIDFPSVVFPVLKVDKTIDLVKDVPEFRTEKEKKVWEMYSPEKSHGVPIGIQVIGPKLQEEYTLELAKTLVKLVDYKP